jgi:hypothetical protein
MCVASVPDVRSGSLAEWLLQCRVPKAVSLLPAQDRSFRYCRLSTSRSPVILQESSYSRNPGPALLYHFGQEPNAYAASLGRRPRFWPGLRPSPIFTARSRLVSAYSGATIG